ncbi:MAG TPA: glycosyl hydrolase family 28-related protein [Verrucomicrobiae bacterium]|jgi:sugar lactone lactonase YvrE|nr:glycosyl hydrolase family 28-related protein [Verrucomicrobiae bacterium]
MPLSSFLARHYHRLVIALIFFSGVGLASSASFYRQPPPDPKAITVTAPTEGDDTVMLQQAIDRVRDTTGQGIVFVAPGRYTITNTIYIWPGIRVIGCGATRPVVVLPANAPGFQDSAREKIMIFFAGGGGRRRNSGARGGPVPDANPGTFYSALSNIDIEVQDGNAGAVVVRSHYAQHCFLAHMDFHLGPALAGIHEAGNVVEDLHFYGGRHAIWTGKPSPSWQFTVVDCSFEDQHEAAILEREAGLTLVRPHFLRVPTAVEIETNGIDELWVKDARLEEISGPAFVFGVEENPRNEINMEGVACRAVPVFAGLRDSGKRFNAPAENYLVKTFSHGFHYSDLGAQPEITNVLEAVPEKKPLPPVASDLAPLPPVETWVNIRDLGAKGDGVSDDTAVFQKAIAEHRAIYLPSGFYVVRDALKLRPDTALIGLHPGATQIIIPDGTPAYAGEGQPKALIEAPKGGSNILFGIGLYTSGNNPRAVAALWKAGAHSMLNDVRFLGGHGTPKPDGSRENPYNRDHSGDPDPNRHWDSQYPSLWVTDGGGGTFFDIWTPSTFAHAGMLISDTDTEGRVYQMSSEHHVKHEIQIHNAAHWRIYALQTEEERGESGLALPLEIESSHDITVANFHSYRVISSFQPFPWAVKVSNSRDIRFRNFHSYSNSKVSFDSAVYDQTHDFEIRQHEFAWLDMSGRAPASRHSAASPVVADGAKVQKVAGGFYNISGGAVGPQGNIYFVDAHSNQVYCWNVSSRQLSTISNAATLSPVNLMMDAAGNLVVVSYNGDGIVYSLTSEGAVSNLKPDAAVPHAEPAFYLPVSDWISQRDSLAHPAAYFVSPDGKSVLPVGRDFLEGATSWGIKSSPTIRSFGLARAAPGRPFYITEESGDTTWAADVQPDGSLQNFHLFANCGGENVASDANGNVYIAAGQIYVYDRTGKQIDTIDVPERPVQILFGGADRKTMYIAARSSLYAVPMRQPGW